MTGGSLTGGYGRMQERAAEFFCGALAVQWSKEGLVK